MMLIQTGIAELDNYIGGFEANKLILIGSRPSMGKTKFAIDMILHNVLKRKMNITYYNFKSLEKTIVHNSIGGKPRAVFQKIFQERITKKAWDERNNGFFNWLKLGLLLAFRSLPAKQKPELIIIDDLHLLLTDELSFSYENRMHCILRNLEFIAKTFKVCIVGLTEIEKDLEYGPRPNPFNFKTSTGERCDSAPADIAISIYREKCDFPESEYNQVESYMMRNRNGEIGLVKSTCD